MHGLTGHHEAAMAGMAAPTPAAAMHEAAESEASSRPASGDQPAPSNGHGMAHEPASPNGHGAAHEPALPSAHGLALPSGHEVALPIALVDAIDRVAIEPAGQQHRMVSACVAVLTALVLLLALVLGLRSLLTWRPVLLVAPTGRVVLSERSPPWLAPSLSKLCVLRT
jgi:hypothetical protein